MKENTFFPAIRSAVCGFEALSIQVPFNTMDPAFFGFPGGLFMETDIRSADFTAFSSVEMVKPS